MPGNSLGEAQLRLSESARECYLSENVNHRSFSLSLSLHKLMSGSRKYYISRLSLIQLGGLTSNRLISAEGGVQCAIEPNHH